MQFRKFVDCVFRYTLSSTKLNSNVVYLLLRRLTNHLELLLFKLLLLLLSHLQFYNQKSESLRDATVYIDDKDNLQPRYNTFVRNLLLKNPISDCELRHRQIFLLIHLPRSWNRKRTKCHQVDNIVQL